MTLLSADDLLALREELHGCTRGRVLVEEEEVVAFGRDRRAVVSSGKGAPASLTEGIAGRRLPGSWMSHPEGRWIYALGGALLRAGFVPAPVVEGKWVELEPSLAPAVASYGLDEARVAAARDGLDEACRTFAGEVESAGSLRADESSLPPKVRAKARRQLERLMLIQSEEVHTDKGHHISVCSMWNPPAEPTMSRSNAEDALVEALLHSSVIAPVKEVRKWFDGSGPALDRLLSRDVAVEVPSEAGAMVARVAVATT